MRLSSIIAKCEDRVITNAPIVKAQAQQATTKARSWLSTKLAAAATKVAPKQGAQG